MLLEDIVAILPQQPPFLFLDSATIDGNQASGKYLIKGTEDFLKGHFKNNPVFPASIMIEALGQLGVLSLICGKFEGITSEVDPENVYFTSSEGVRCHRVCKPGDTLELNVQLKKLRHPLAIFSGKITVNNSKTVMVESFTLSFD